MQVLTLYRSADVQSVEMMQPDGTWALVSTRCLAVSRIAGIRPTPIRLSVEHTAHQYKRGWFVRLAVDQGVDLPEAGRAIEVWLGNGSRAQEAQRVRLTPTRLASQRLALPRLLSSHQRAPIFSLFVHPFAVWPHIAMRGTTWQVGRLQRNFVSSDGNKKCHAEFHSLFTASTNEVEFATARMTYLREQGYTVTERAQEQVSDRAPALQTDYPEVLLDDTGTLGNRIMLAALMVACCVPL